MVHIMKIGEKIKQRRIELNWSQRELAKRMNYSNHSTIGKIEAGKVDIPQSRLEQFCKVLNVNMLYFLGDEYLDSSDAEFINSLGTIHPKEDVPPEIEAVNTLLYSSGLQIMKTQGKYYFDEAGQLSEEELNEFLNTVITMVRSTAEGFIKKKTKQNMIDFFGKKN